jgi:NCS2 family nucleobase:cation symporter-2
VLTYIGLPLQFPDTAPSRDEILETDDGAQRLSGFLIRRYADQIKSTSNNGLNEIRLHFDH